MTTTEMDEFETPNIVICGRVYAPNINTLHQKLLEL